MKPTYIMMLTAMLGIGVAGTAFAESAADVELLSAQKAYQEALKTKQSHSSQFASKQQALTAARQRLSEVQSNITQLEAEVTAAQSADTQSQQTLQQAGERLDAAWRAARSQ